MVLNAGAVMVRNAHNDGVFQFPTLFQFLQEPVDAAPVQAEIFGQLVLGNMHLSGSVRSFSAHAIGNILHDEQQASGSGQTGEKHQIRSHGTGLACQTVQKYAAELRTARQQFIRHVR